MNNLAYGSVQCTKCGQVVNNAKHECYIDMINKFEKMAKEDEKEFKKLLKESKSSLADMIMDLRYELECLKEKVK